MAITKYKVKIFQFISEEALQTQLDNYLALEGWELLCILPAPGGASNQLLVIFCQRS